MKTKDLNTKVFAYILDCINGEPYGKTFNSRHDVVNTTDKLRFLRDTFESEYGWHIDRSKNFVASFAEWCKGLPSSFHIVFTNYDIIQLAKEWGSLPLDATERQEDRMLENYWHFIANKTFQLFKKYEVN